MENRIDRDTARKTVGMFIGTDRLHRKAFENLVSGLGIHRSQHRMLMHLAKDEGMSQTDLAAHLEISTAAVAVTIKKLEAGGYIEKKTAENDSRFNEIKITDRGREIVSASEKYFHDVDTAMLSGIDGEMLDNFISCLEIMQKNLKELCEPEKKEEE